MFEQTYLLHFGLLFAAAVWAGAQNQLAGGGSFITLPALILTGMDARAANISSTIALFPGQVAGGWMGRKLASGADRVSLRALTVTSLVGGAAGAILLLLTPTSVFERMVPWLVLFATVAFAWGSFGHTPKAEDGGGLHPAVTYAIQFVVAIYGGYFGGGVGFLMLAALALSHIPVRSALATKNVLAGAMNFTAVVIFLFSGEIRWLAASIACAGAFIGSYFGARTLHKIPDKALRVIVVLIGVLLTIGLFIRSSS